MSVSSRSFWAIWLFTFRATTCVYRFISYQQNRKPIGSPVPDKNLVLLLPDNNSTISLSARRMGQRRRATRALSRCYTAERLCETLTLSKLILGLVIARRPKADTAISYSSKDPGSSGPTGPYDHTGSFNLDELLSEQFSYLLLALMR